MADRLRGSTIAFGLLAGDAGSIIEETTQEDGVQNQFVRIPSQTRINATIADRPNRAATSFDGPESAVPMKALASHGGLLRPWPPFWRALVAAGSTPPEVRIEICAAEVRTARALAAMAFLDADEDPPSEGVGAAPDLIEPNLGERLFGLPLREDQGAREQVPPGVGAVVLSMGRHGAVDARQGRARQVHPASVERRSTAGSSDATSAGLALERARGDGMETGLRLGAAPGAATAASPRAALGAREDAEVLLPRAVVEVIP